MGKIIYEGVFFNHAEIESAFFMVRGDCPYPITPKDYHVTTVFSPEHPLTALYGTAVTAEVTAYKRDETLLDADGNPAHNEGFAVRIFTDNATLQAHFDTLLSQGKNFHITGSFLKKGDAVYTNNIDFSTGATPCSFLFHGVFRGYEAKRR